MRQEKAAKLTNCKCDGSEEYDCRAIQKNMQRLCFRKHKRPRHGFKNESSIIVHHHVDNNHKEKTVTKHRKTTTISPIVVVSEKPNHSMCFNINFFVLSLSILVVFMT